MSPCQIIYDFYAFLFSRKEVTKVSFIACSFLLFSFLLEAQRPMNCVNDPPPVQTANEAEPLCEGLDALNEYCFTLQAASCPVESGNFPGCDDQVGQLDNPNWFSFVAGADSISLEINVVNCQNPTGPNGVQIGLYVATSDLDTLPECDATTLPLEPIMSSGLPECGPTCVEGLATYSNIPTIVGSTYYLVFDGCVGDVCDVYITVLAGGQAPQIPDAVDIEIPLAGFNVPVGNDPDTICAGAQNFLLTTPDILYASSYLWTLPSGSGVITDGPQMSVDFPNTPGASFEFCVQGRNECDTSINLYCKTIVLASLDTIMDPSIFLCQHDSMFWRGVPIGPFDQLENDSVFTLFIDAEDNVLFNCNRVFTVQMQLEKSTGQLINLTTIDTICDLMLNSYTVSFSIEGVDAGDVVVNPPGTLNGLDFISDPIPSSTPFSFVVTDINGCGLDSISGIHSCACLSSIGSLRHSPLNLCEGDTLFATNFYDPAGQVIVGNDVRNYILSQNAVDPLNTIIRTNLDGKFEFSHDDLDFGTTYYISVIIGRQSELNVVNVFDPCLLMTEMIEVTWFNRLDEFNISASETEINCEHPILDLTFSTMQDTQGYHISWQATNGGSFNPLDSFNHELQVSAPGQYILAVEHLLAGCIAFDTVDISMSPDLPEILLNIPDTLTCLLNETPLSGLGSTTGPSILYRWYGPEVIGDSTSVNTNAAEGGTYVFELTDTDNNCIVSDSVFVFEDRDQPDAFANAADKIGCVTTEIAVSGAGSSIGFDYTYAWRSLADSGNIISDTSQRDILVDLPGLYQLVVTDTDNGCMASAITEVEVEQNMIESADVNLSQPACDGLKGGAISVRNIIGGIRPYSYSYDGGLSFVADSFKDDLAPGIYYVLTRDANGCQLNDTITLTAPFEFFVDLGADKMISLGEDVVLMAQTDLPDSLQENIVWSPLFDSLNQNSLVQMLSPNVGVYNIAIAITNPNGCLESDDVTVFVKFEKRIYIPTALRPSSSNQENKYLNIYADPIIVAEINTFEIFDRWGGRVHFRQDVPVNLQLNSLYAWDGRVNGKPANSGVYTYLAKVTYINGVTEILSGEVTLID